jgi:hypothetical protein
MPLYVACACDDMTSPASISNDNYDVWARPGSVDTIRTRPAVRPKFCSDQTKEHTPEVFRTLKARVVFQTPDLAISSTSELL